ncbi:hypothetical protein HYPSUDRAFT_322635 [Hypholoma sublateritium FD-334 SS-4]|uniref:Uncharacterized protein n=1 Tax=Hypholoma sublateritium (strain FD-334 SS-4) TaxID=945553 RepID=A0A0D2KNH1_HYPSF|nr:hypothetical protein HYPSUDRAFT_322635 [Hypholoma sublateritium FD-334 SS-4]
MYVATLPASRLRVPHPGEESVASDSRLVLGIYSAHWTYPPATGLKRLCACVFSSGGEIVSRLSFLPLLFFATSTSIHPLSSLNYALFYGVSFLPGDTSVPHTRWHDGRRSGACAQIWLVIRAVPRVFHNCAACSPLARAWHTLEQKPTAR